LLFSASSSNDDSEVDEKEELWEIELLEDDEGSRVGSGVGFGVSGS